MSRFLTSVLVTLVSILLVQGCMTDAPPDEPIGTRADALTSTFRPTVDETLTYTDGSGSGTNRAIGGHNTTCAGSGRGAYLLFNVTSIPSNATVSSATLDITYYTDCASSSSDKCNQAQTLHVYEASASLSATSGTDTGSMGGVCGGLVGGGAAINISTSSLDSVSAAAGSHTVTFNGTSLRNAVRGWVSNSSSNHGLVVGGDANGIKMIRGGTHGSRPVLTVEWTRGNGSSCTSGTECTSGNCVDNRCCGSTSCPTCQDCTGSNGTCVNQGAGDDNTGANQCTGNNTCNSSGQCLKDRGQTCSGAGECASNFCSPDGFCCNNACSGGGVCQVCSSGTCGNVPVATDPFDQCTHACNGSGSCGTNCDEDTDCASGYYCSGGNCVVQGGGGDACTSSNQCGSGLVCSVDGVCCNSTCSGTCESCLNAENGGAGQGVCAPSPQHTDYASECAPGSCSGSSSCGTSCSQDSHCDGTAWCNGTTCITKYPNGNACSETRQCQSGICVDGVCCDGACGGQCEACDNVGSVGTCTPTSGAPHGARPVCSGDGTACNGVCDGSSRTQCALPGGSVECRPASCSAGQETAQTFCVGNGSCPAATVNACAPYQCGGTGCLSSCTVDTQCQLGYRCEVGACVPARPNGEACTANTECASGYCIDGFCCNSACNGQCEACNVSGSEGSCSAVTGAPVGSRPSCADDGTACGGSCNGVARTACAYPSSTTQCRAASCETTSGTATLAAGCNGAGACPPLQTLSCPSGMCTGDACGNDCTADADCGVDEYCAAGVCQPTQNLGSPCARSAECASGRCVDGYCCNNACTGQCEACDVSGSEGVCSAVTGAPHGSRTACTDDGTGCGGSCDGTNQAACSYPGNGTVCRSAACSAGIATVEARCAGNGNCPSLQQQTCSPYTCHPSLPLCDGDCTVDGDCPSPQYCLAGICANPQGNGASCSTAAQCASGNCVDGVCCDDTCGGQCQSCSEPGSIGTCSLVAGTPRGGRPACTGTGVCAGACDGTNAGCAFPGGETVCGLGSCTNDVAVPDVSCNGAGDCRTQTPQSCAPYHCGTGSSCSTNCVTADDCQDGYECNNGACEAVPSVGGAGGTGGAAGAAGAAGTAGASTGGASTGGTAGVGGTGGTLADAGVNTEDAGNGLIPATDTGSTCRLAPASRSSNPWGIYALSLLGLLVSRRRRMPRRAVNA